MNKSTINGIVIGFFQRRETQPFLNITVQVALYSESFRVSILTSEKKESTAGVGCGPPQKFVVENLEAPVEAKESRGVFGAFRRCLVQTKARKKREKRKTVSFKVEKSIRDL